MTANVTFFPVGNGDMTLLQLAGPNNYTILIDCYLQSEPSDCRPTVAKDLYDCLPVEYETNRPYVDAFLLSHPDDDHCHGAAKFLHLGAPDEYSDDPAAGEPKKIFVREMWSSPMIFRRACKKNPLSPDAKAIAREARRRVQVYRDSASHQIDGNRILIIGDDQKAPDGSDKLSGLNDICVAVGEAISVSDSAGVTRLVANVLAPITAENEEEEEQLTKNDSSVIMRMNVHILDTVNAEALLLFGGDARTGIWSRLYNRHKSDLTPLDYDILLAPHHCSWSVFSETPPEKNAEVDQDSRRALERARGSAYIVASSKPIKNDEDNPPAFRAKEEYADILDDNEHQIFCTGEYPDEDDPKPLKFVLSAYGPRPPSKKGPHRSAVAMATGLTETPRPHGRQS